VFSQEQATRMGAGIVISSDGGGVRPI
jgi:hypothetical protein